MKSGTCLVLKVVVIEKYNQVTGITTCSQQYVSVGVHCVM